MQSFTYKIQSPALRPFIRFILFNHATADSPNSTVTYYPNHDICIGILHNKRLEQQSEGLIALPHSKPLHSYIAGIYDSPLPFHSTGYFNEISLPFSTLGFHSFFNIPFQTFMLQDDVIHELLGPTANARFQDFFEIKDLDTRGQQIESFLVSKIPLTRSSFLSRALQFLHSNHPGTPINTLLAELHCSERTLQRAFRNHLDISPKTYQQVRQFRQALWFMQTTPRSLTDIAHECHYFDQSHFIRAFQTFTHATPTALRTQAVMIDDNVICRFSK